MAPTGRTHLAPAALVGLALLGLAPPFALAQSCWRVVPILTRNASAPACSARALDTGLLTQSDRVTSAVAAGRAASDACYRQQLARDSSNAAQNPVTIGTPEYHHYLTQTPPPFAVESYNMSLMDACLELEVARAFQNEFNVSLEASGEAIPQLNLTAPSAIFGRPPQPSCDANAVYRTFDGSCNNLVQPTMGLADTPYIRLLPPAYGDGLYSPRLAADGGPLPNARLVRQSLIGASDWPAVLLSHMAMQWGQLVAHDTLLSIDSFGISGLGVECCARDNSVPSHRVPLRASQLPLVCLPVNGPDAYCLSIVRSNVTRSDDQERLVASEQLNAVSHWLDASAVYGSDDATAASLREGASGRLRESSGAFLPQQSDPRVSCDPRRDPAVCYLAGDVRVNQNTGITSLQTLMVREHNRVAAELSRQNPGWDDERLFQETRRIVVAEYQHITFSGMIPVYVGPAQAQIYGLVPTAQGYHPRGYDPQVDGSTLNSFATAAYRVFHGIAHSFFDLVSPVTLCPFARLRMASWFDTPSVVSNPPEHLDEILLGLAFQSAQAVDTYYPDGLLSSMFETNIDPGQDLGAFDIVRSRDHGMPSYVAFRELCGGGRATRWGDLQGDFSSDTLHAMSYVYDCVDDIDLFTGIFLERPIGDASVGPTGNCIVIEQFLRKMVGDRFFYSFQGQTGSFTEGQLNQIKKVTLSRLLCDNGDNITSTTMDAFLQKNFMNPVVDCRDIPSVDLSLWKE